MGIRLPAPLIEDVEAWAEKNEAKSRSQAIRRLVEIGLKAKVK
ncbi:ribbon-helix-helix protein, CopG family [Nitrobacter sp. JJSN]